MHTADNGESHSSGVFSLLAKDSSQNTQVVVILRINSTLIVSRGLGNSSFPVRINNRIELVLVTLKKRDSKIVIF